MHLIVPNRITPLPENVLKVHYRRNQSLPYYTEVQRSWQNRVAQCRGSAMSVRPERDLTTFNFKPQNLSATWRWQVRKDTYIIVIPCFPLFYSILPRFVYNVFFESCEQTKIFSYCLLLLLICFEYHYNNPILVASFKS